MVFHCHVSIQGCIILKPELVGHFEGNSLILNYRVKGDQRAGTGRYNLPLCLSTAHPRRTRDEPRSNQAPWLENVSCET